MIQRIQNLFLAFAAVIMVLMFFFSIADFYGSMDSMTGNYKLFLTGLKSMDPNPRVNAGSLMTLPLALLAAASVILSVIAIVYFRKRTVQLRLLAFNVLLTIVLIIVVFLFYMNSVQKMTGNPPVYEFGIFCPLIGLVFLIIANWFIRRDEKLIKSAGRLR